MLGAGDEARAGRERIGMRIEKSETKGSGRRKESTGWEDEGNGLEKEGLIPAPGQLPPDPGTPAELTSLASGHWTQVRRAAVEKIIFPKFLRVFYSGPTAHLPPTQDKSLTALNVNTLFHSGLGGWGETRRLKGICNPLFKGCLVAEDCRSPVDVVV